MSRCNLHENRNRGVSNIHMNIAGDQKIEDSQNKGEDKYSNLFSMIGTIFLWVYWPSFNGGTAATGDGQMRAFTNTYLSLCACAVTTFAISAGTNPKRQWVMEHIQNATLAE